MRFLILFLFFTASLSAYDLNRKPFWNIAPLPAKHTKKKELRIAFWNLQTQWVSDSSKYLKYKWKRRIQPIVELILRNRPDILGVCECNLRQVDDLKKTLKKAGYALFAISSETLKDVDGVKKLRRKKHSLNYGEFVGVLYKKSRLQLLNTRAHPLKRGRKHARVLVETHFRDRLSKKKFVVLTSHFDHILERSRKLSAKKELRIIKQFEKKKLPWFSLSDRNWNPDKKGQKSAEKYALKPFITDFRDRTSTGHFGVWGTFVGHLGLASNNSRPVIILENGLRMCNASSVDVCFRSRRLVTGINSFTFTGEFDPETYRLLPCNRSGDVAKRNFASDHFYHGGTFIIN